jgi:hypothetical protein
MKPISHLTVSPDQILTAAERLAYLNGLDKNYSNEEVALALQVWLQRHLDEVLAEPECFAKLSKLLPDKQLA